MLKIEDFDLEMIASVMQEDDSMGARYYLNTDTGEVVLAGYDDVESGFDPEDQKYTSIDHLESYESYGHMEEFTLDLPDGKARAELEKALIRHKPFRRFKDALGHFPVEREAWYRFKDEAMRRVIAQWLIGIKAIEDPDPDGTAEGELE